MIALFELDDEWEPICPAGVPARCRDCGTTQHLNQGSGLSMVCDGCADVDGCRVAVEGHVSHWGHAHPTSEHDGLVAARDRRRAAYRKKAA